MKKLILALILISGLQTQGQSPLYYGMYTSKYGDMNFFEEYGPEYPNKNIIYGDYGTKGTTVGFLLGNENIGKFYNGTKDGQFRLNMSTLGSLPSFIGTWGYTSNNANTADKNYWWDGNAKSKGMPSCIVNAVWSGKWNTNHGFIILEQVGNKVTGKYDNVGTIDATYNPTTRILKGTFVNNGKNGFFEYSFEGNSFKGKWGWTNAFTGGQWNGTKAYKTNKEIFEIDFIKQSLGEWTFNSILTGEKIAAKIKIEDRGTVCEPKFVAIISMPTQVFLDFSVENTFTTKEYNLTLQRNKDTSLPNYFFAEISSPITLLDKGKPSTTTNTYLSLIPLFDSNNKIINLGVTLNTRTKNLKTNNETSSVPHINVFLKTMSNIKVLDYSQINNQLLKQLQLPINK
ncbi:hypothetical protein LXD69_08410 [Flavobacterium sediminilitoris]|uniref:MORN repeat protein n=1 Tax=Flavobacterium sediminilitoris TaxID=2024526 RepID=A0ABY4HRL4_9FLAO|nr:MULTISPECIES: hypothetical protein [Flavobacterium]UOX35532.1 hypothetical protein LXD69_08410 [Flavobacterium sediminilitoris]